MGTVKDQQSQMRYSTAKMTLDVYTQSVSESLKAAVEAFDYKLRSRQPLEDPHQPGSESKTSKNDSEPQSASVDYETQKGF